MKWDNTDLENKKKWVVKSKRPIEYQTLKGTTAEFRNFLNTQPDVKTIALELSGLVDLLLVTGNRGWIGEEEPGEFQLLDTWQQDTSSVWWIDKYIPSFWRIDKTFFVKWALRRWVEEEVKKYKDTFEAPWIYFSSAYTFTCQVGFCEEHAGLACYLLIFGGLHPGSKPPLHIMYKDTESNDPNREIYFSIVGADLGVTKHAFVVIVKGDEFAKSIKNLTQQMSANGTTDRGKVFEYLSQHPELWGENAWVADGWLGNSYPAADIQKTLKTGINVVGDFTFGLHPDWEPFNFKDLFLRVCEHYDINWD